MTINFDVKLGAVGYELVDPHWGLTGEPLRPILTDFDTIIEKTIVLGENVLVRLFYKLKGNAPLEILDIPPARSGQSTPPHCRDSGCMRSPAKNCVKARTKPKVVMSPSTAVGHLHKDWQHPVQCDNAGSWTIGVTNV